MGAKDTAQQIIHALLYAYPCFEQVLQTAKNSNISCRELMHAIRREKQLQENDPPTIELHCFINFTDQHMIQELNRSFSSVFGMDLGLVAMTRDDYHMKITCLVNAIKSLAISELNTGESIDDLIKKLYTISWTSGYANHKVISALHEINCNIPSELQQSFQDAVNKKFHPPIDFPELSSTATTTTLLNWIDSIL